nr:hypothetical protein [Tanacetum cinerariifolium]
MVATGVSRNARQSDSKDKFHLTKMVPRSREIWKSDSDYMRERDRNLHIFSIKDVLVDQDDAEFTPMATLDNEDVRKSHQTIGLKRYTKSGGFSRNTCLIIFIRVYETQIDLLRAAIIGPEGTPYYDGFFVFDMWFPRTYPHYPLLVKYYHVRLTNKKLLDDACMKNFEELVVGPFRNCVRDILMACEAYIEGREVGCFVKGVQEKGDYETCTIVFRNDVASCVKPLVTAFYKIGAKEAVDFLPLVGPKPNQPD